MKSWRQIPRSYCVLPPSSIHPVTMKSWMFNNLPDNHVYQLVLEHVQIFSISLKYNPLTRNDEYVFHI